MQAGFSDRDMKRELFGSRLRELRLRVDRTQEEIAAGARVSLATYNKAENGRANLNFDTICRLAPALEVEVADLFRFDHHTARRRRHRSSIQ
jgi:HTH-type transcriptional regulator, competence development regulator